MRAVLVHLYVWMSKGPSGAQDVNVSRSFHCGTASSSLTMNASPRLLGYLASGRAAARDDSRDHQARYSDFDVHAHVHGSRGLKAASARRCLGGPPSRLFPVHHSNPQREPTLLVRRSSPTQSLHAYPHCASSEVRRHSLITDALICQIRSPLLQS